MTFRKFVMLFAAGWLMPHNGRAERDTDDNRQYPTYRGIDGKETCERPEDVRRHGSFLRCFRTEKRK